MAKRDSVDMINQNRINIEELKGSRVVRGPDWKWGKQDGKRVPLVCLFSFYFDRN